MEVVAQGRSLRTNATFGRLVGDHFLRVQLLYACGCLRFRRPRHTLLVSRRTRSALASLRVLCPRPSTRATSVWGRRTITNVRVHAIAPGGATMQLPAAKTSMRTRRESRPPGPHLFLRPFTFISRLTRHNKHTHEDNTERTSSGSNGAPRGSNGAPPWLQWRSQRPTTTTAGSSPRIM